MSNELLVSVIIPMYNVETTLERAIKSVLQQKHQLFEILLIDDGSTDNTSEIARKMMNEDSRIFCYKQTKKGVSRARNYGLEVAKGDLIAFLDSDDYFEKDMLATACSDFSDTEVNLVVFNFERIDESGNRKTLRAIEEVTNLNSNGLKNIFIYNGFDFYLWNKVYRKELFKDVSFPEGKIYEDIVPTYLVFKASPKVVFHDKVGYFYINNAISIVNQHFNPAQYENVTQREILVELIKKDFPELVNYGFSKLMDGYLSTGYKISSSMNSEVKTVYLKKLRGTIRKNKKSILQNNESGIAKKLGLLLLLWNHNLYSVLYKKLLNK